MSVYYGGRTGLELTKNVRKYLLLLRAVKFDPVWKYYKLHPGGRCTSTAQRGGGLDISGRYSSWLTLLAYTWLVLKLTTLGREKVKHTRYSCTWWPDKEITKSPNTAHRFKFDAEKCNELIQISNVCGAGKKTLYQLISFLRRMRFTAKSVSNKRFIFTPSFILILLALFSAMNVRWRRDACQQLRKTFFHKQTKTL